MLLICQLIRWHFYSPYPWTLICDQRQTQKAPRPAHRWTQNQKRLEPSRPRPGSRKRQAGDWKTGEWQGEPDAVQFAGGCRCVGCIVRYIGRFLKVWACPSYLRSRFRYSPSTARSISGSDMPLNPSRRFEWRIEWVTIEVKQIYHPTLAGDDCGMIWKINMKLNSTRGHCLNCGLSGLMDFTDF